MKFIKLETTAPREAVLAYLKSSEQVNRGVKFDERRGRPLIKVKDKETSSRLSVTCEMIGGPSKDNGFIVGTFFVGKLTEKGGVTRLRGIILTAPIYHLMLIAFCIYFLIQSFVVGGFTLVPIFAVAFTVMLFRDEYKKQGIIQRYFARAIRYAENNLK